jgi:hypothetical protein
VKRSAQLSRSTPLRRSRFMRSNRKSKYRRRERDVERMRWTKRQPCIVRSMPPVHAVELGGFWDSDHVVTMCSGPVEADHMGERGLGQKADDNTCVPMCRGHHRERTDHSGTFRPLTRDELRAWRARAIEITQAKFTSSGDR